MRNVNALAAVLLAPALSCGPIVNKSDDSDRWRSHFDNGKALHKGNELEAAEVEFLESMKHARAENPPGFRIALTKNALGVLYTAQNRIDEARPLLYEARSIFEFRNETENIYFVSVLSNIGDMELRRRGGLEAESVYRRALAILSRIQEGVPSSIAARSLRGLVASLCVQGRKEEAKELGRFFQLECQ